MAIYEILTHRETPGDCGSNKVPCCPDYHEFDPFVFLGEMKVDQCGRYEAAAGLIRSIQAVAKALHQAFDFTDSTAVSSAIFKHAEGISDTFRITDSPGEVQASELSALTPMQAFASHTLLRPNDAVKAYPSGPEARRILPDFLALLSPDRSVGRDIEKVLQQYSHQQSEQVARQVAELRAEIESLRQRLAHVEGKKPSRRNPPDESES